MPARGGHITRVEVLGGRYLYAITCTAPASRFNCARPTSASDDGGAGRRGVPGGRAEEQPAGRRHDPPAEVIADVERIMARPASRSAASSTSSTTATDALLLRHQRAVELRRRRPAGGRVRPVRPARGLPRARAAVRLAGQTGPRGRPGVQSGEPPGETNRARRSITPGCRRTTVPPPPTALLARAASGELEAFGAIYERYQHAVFRFACAMTGSRDAAANITHDAFWRCWPMPRASTRTGPRCPRTSTASSAICAGNASAAPRGCSRWTPAFRSARRPWCPIDPVADAELAGLVRRALAELPSRYRELLLLCDVHDLSYADAAAIVGTSVPAVRSRLHRGRQQLRALLSARMASPLSLSGPNGVPYDDDPTDLRPRFVSPGVGGVRASRRGAHGPAGAGGARPRIGGGAHAARACPAAPGTGLVAGLGGEHRRGARGGVGRWRRVRLAGQPG